MSNSAEITRTIAYRNVVDLTHPIHPGIPLWPGDPPVRFRATADIGSHGYFLRQFCMGEHSGTHLSSSAAFYPDAAGPADLPAAALIIPAVVIDISRSAAANPDYALTPDDIAGWERQYGPVPADSMALLFTGWQQYWSIPERFINADANGIMHTPGFGHDAARILLAQRGAAGLGSDAPGIDPGATRNWPSAGCPWSNPARFWNASTTCACCRPPEPPSLWGGCLWSAAAARRRQYWR